MNVPAKTEYACLAMIELSMRYTAGEPVRIRAIAERHGIPSRFLVQILLQLKGAGLVTSTRGAAGGYQLARDPRGISLLEIIDVVEGRGADTPAPAAASSPFAGILLDVWSEVTQCMRQQLASVSLADLVERAANTTEEMYYI